MFSPLPVPPPTAVTDLSVCSHFLRCSIFVSNVWFEPLLVTTAWQLGWSSSELNVSWWSRLEIENQSTGCCCTWSPGILFHLASSGFFLFFCFSLLDRLFCLFVNIRASVALATAFKGLAMWLGARLPRLTFFLAKSNFTRRCSSLSVFSFSKEVLLGSLPTYWSMQC